MTQNLPYYGDNLDVLRRHVKDETVDLVALRDAWLNPPAQEIGVTISRSMLNRRTLTNLYNDLDHYRRQVKGQTRSPRRWDKETHSLIPLDIIEDLDHIHTALGRAVLDAYGRPHTLKGIEKLAGSTRKSAVQEWLEEDLLIRFRDRILPINTAVMLVWGQLAADLDKQGKRMPAIDAMIAATCLQGRLDLVTRNESDFAHSSVTLINPWTQ